jgi:hypothetical protein
VELHHFERDDVVYTLTALRTAVGHSVMWRCTSCGNEGPYDFDDDSAAAAIGRTDARIYVEHHVPMHLTGHSVRQGSRRAS